MVVIMFPKKYEPNITRALDSVTHLLIRYFTGIVAESSIMTLIVSLGLLMLGFSVHNALVIGLIVGVLNVIPYLGPWIGAAAGIFIGVAGTAEATCRRPGLRCAWPERFWSLRVSTTSFCNRCSTPIGRKPIRSKFFW